MTFAPPSILDLAAFWEQMGGVSLGIVGNQRELQRFWAKVRLPADLSDCWVWTASGTRGYGLFYPQRPGTYAHRYSYVLFHGSIPDGLEIDHLCRNRACVNPTHLEAVTHQVNVRRGVGLAASEALVTHCPRGHEYNEVNTYIVRQPTRLPKRQCRRCKAVNQRAYTARRRMAA